MHVRILGPIEVVGPSGARGVPGLRRKALLAALALEPGRVVSAERLTALVWGEDVPPTCRNTLQAHISYLRRVCGDRAAVRSVAPGYVLTLPTDAQAAEEFVREAAQTDDLVRRAERARRAIELWRGSALDDVLELAAFQGAARRLDDVRTRARRLLLDADLALGLVEQAVDEAEALWRDHPLDEQAGSLLMLTLCRAGRRASALAVGRELRRVLQEELGVAPGPETLELEAAILRQDPDLLSSAPGAVGSSDRPWPVVLRASASAPDFVAVPAQLPGAVHLVGREAEIRALDAVLALVADPDASPAGPAAIAVVTGAAGVGKSALAGYWSRRAAYRFPDGQLYADLGCFGPAGGDPAETLGAFLVALGVPDERVPAGRAARAALFRGALVGKRVLILLDNARDGAQVRPLLPGGPGCLVVVTSRDRLTSLVACEGAVPVPVGTLNAEAAHALLVRRLGPARVAAEPRAVRAVVENCEGLPLALGLAAAWAATHPRMPLAVFAAEVVRASKNLDTLDGRDRRAVFSWSYRTLAEHAARLYRLQSHRPPGARGFSAGSVPGQRPGPG